MAEFFLGALLFAIGAGSGIGFLLWLFWEEDAEDDDQPGYYN